MPGMDARPTIYDHNGQPITPRPDGMPIPHAVGFVATVGSAMKAYYHGRYDEAVRHSRESALVMRNDCSLMGMLQERKLAVASLPWHLTVPNENDPRQAYVRDQLRKQIETIRGLPKLLMGWLEAIWYGRQAAQFQWAWARDEQGRRLLRPARWLPVNGDKVGHHQDGTPYILVNVAEADKLPGAQLIDTTAGGRGLLLNGSWRERFVIHSHELVDADFFDAEAGDAVFGVGVRSVVFALDWIKREWLSNFADYIERVGLGVELWYYDASNPKSKTEVQRAMQDLQGQRTRILVPRWGAERQPSLERIETPSAGCELLIRLMGWVEEVQQRYINGQHLSSNSTASGGLGNEAAAEFQADTKNQIRNFDAKNLAETITGDPVEPGLLSTMQMWSYPETLPGRPGGFKVSFEFQLEGTESDQKLQAAATVVGLGLAVKADEVRAAGGFSKPAPGDETLGGQQAMPPGPDGQPGQPGQDQPPGQGQPPQGPAGQPKPPPGRHGIQSPDEYEWVEQDGRASGADHYALGPAAPKPTAPSPAPAPAPRPATHLAAPAHAPVPFVPHAPSQAVAHAPHAPAVHAHPPDHVPRTRKLGIGQAIPHEAKPETYGHHEGDVRRALRHYTSDYGHNTINAALRGRAKPDAATVWHINHISKALKSAQPLPKPLTVWRGLSLDQDSQRELIEKATAAQQSGQRLRMRGFASTSLDPKTASNFSGFGGSNNALVFEILAKKGLHLQSVSDHEEDEFLMDHNSEFTVKGVKDVPFGTLGATRRVIQLEHHLPEQGQQHGPQRMARDGSPVRYEGRWITIGGSKGADGKRHGGSPVFVEGGRITKGHPSLAGKKLSALDEEGEADSARKAVNRERGHARATWAKKAKQQGVAPKALHQLAGELLAHDKAYKDDLRDMLQQARKTHAGLDYGSLATLKARASKGIDADQVKGLDDTAARIAEMYPHHFHGHDDLGGRLFELLSQGNPEPMSEDDAYEQAHDHLTATRAGQEEDGDPVPFSREPMGYAYDPGEARASDGKWTGGEGQPGQRGAAAVGAHAKYRDLLAQAKQARKEAHGHARSEAKAAHEKIGATYQGILDKHNSIASLEPDEGDSDDFHEAYTNLDELVTGYDEGDSLAHRVAHVKEIKGAAKEALRLRKRAKGLAPEDHAANEQALRGILGHVDEFMEHVKTVAGHQRNARAIREGRDPEHFERQDEPQADQDDDDRGERGELIAAILHAIYGDAAEGLFDAGHGAEDADADADRYERGDLLRYAWDPIEHPRGKGGRFIPRHSAEAVAAAKEHVARQLKEKPSAEGLKALVSHLSILNVKQLHDLKKEHGLSASGKAKAGLVGKIADRLHRGRRDHDEDAREEPGATDAGNRGLSEEAGHRPGGSGAAGGDPASHGTAPRGWRGRDKFPENYRQVIDRHIEAMPKAVRDYIDSAKPNFQHMTNEELEKAPGWVQAGLRNAAAACLNGGRIIFMEGKEPDRKIIQHELIHNAWRHIPDSVADKAVAAAVQDGEALYKLALGRGDDESDEYNRKKVARIISGAKKAQDKGNCLEFDLMMPQTGIVRLAEKAGLQIKDAQYLTIALHSFLAKKGGYGLPGAYAREEVLAYRAMQDDELASEALKHHYAAPDNPRAYHPALSRDKKSWDILTTGNYDNPKTEHLGRNERNHATWESAVEAADKANAAAGFAVKPPAPASPEPAGGGGKGKEQRTGAKEPHEFTKDGLRKAREAALEKATKDRDFPYSSIEMLFGALPPRLKNIAGRLKNENVRGSKRQDLVDELFEGMDRHYGPTKANNISAFLSQLDDKFHRTKDRLASVDSDHRSAVEAALAAGKPVPDAVLADYPDLKGKGQS
jgi:hypothetical protein